MKLNNMFLGGLLALTIGATAQAGTFVHITGSTAFRKATVKAIENLMLTGGGGNTYSDGTAISAGKFRAAFVGTTGANAEQGATYIILQGNIPGCNNPVTVKGAWSGSTGGLITTKNQLDVTNTNPNGLMSVTNLAGLTETAAVGATTIVGLSSPSYASDVADTNALKTQITMADSLQQSAGISGLNGASNGNGTAPAGCVGIVPFEWVANNGVTAPVKFTGCTSGSGSSTITFTSATYVPTGSAATAAQAQAVNILGGSGIARNVGVTVSASTVSGTTSGTITLASAATSGTSGLTFVGAVSGTNPITATSTLLEQALLQNGGTLLSQFTGNTSDAGTAVYAMGRNFDSGTRLSELAETAVGVFAGLNAQVQPVFVGVSGTAANAYPGVFGSKGTGGGADKYVSTLDQWSAENIFPSPYTKSYSLGQSGFNGGGDLADAMAAAGSVGALPTGGSGSSTAPFFSGLVNNEGGWLVAYLGRSDAERACKTTTGANTAHRLTYNGFSDWNGSTFNADGTPASGYNNTAITEGLYPCWEYEFLYTYSGVSSDQSTVANKICKQIFDTDVTAAGIKYGDMNVSKSIEGGVITHN